MSLSKPVPPGAATDRAAAAAPAAQGGSSPYARFIPREELGSFAAWNPNEFDSQAAKSAPGAAAAAMPGGAPSVATQSAASAPPGRATAGRPHPRAAHAAPKGPTSEELAAQVQAARQAGYQDGYRDGLAALENFKHSFTAQLTQQLGSQASAVNEQFQCRLDSIEQQLAGRLAGVALELARQVVRSEITQRPEMVVHVAEEALAALLTSARQVTVRLHPDDQAVVAHSLKESLHARGAKLLVDPAVKRGGVLVESDIAIVDAGVEARWRKASALLGSRDEWGNAPTHEADEEGA